MKIKTSVLLFVLSFSFICCNYAQNYKINEKLLTIEKTGLSGLKIGDDLNLVKKVFKGCEIIKNEDGKTYVYAGKELLLNLWPDENNKIVGIEIVSNKFRTKDGIKTQMPMKMLLRTIGKQRLLISEGSDEVVEYFEPKECQTYKNNKPYINFLICIATTRKGNVGKYPKHYLDENVSTDEYDVTNSYVKYISIYTEEL